MLYKDFYITLSPKKLKSHIIKQLKMMLSISETEAFQRIKVMGTRNCEKKTGIKFNLFKKFFCENLRMYIFTVRDCMVCWFDSHCVTQNKTPFTPCALCRGHIVFIQPTLQGTYRLYFFLVYSESLTRKYVPKNAAGIN